MRGVFGCLLPDHSPSDHFFSQLRRPCLDTKIHPLFNRVGACVTTFHFFSTTLIMLTNNYIFISAKDILCERPLEYAMIMQWERILLIQCGLLYEGRRSVVILE